MDLDEAGRPKLQLAPEVVASLEREKQALLNGLHEDSLLAKLRAKRDAAREAKPRDLDAVEAAEAEARQPGFHAEPPPLVLPAPAAPLTFDATELSELADRAQFYQAEFEHAEAEYTVARQNRDRARSEFLGYLQEHGVPLR